MNGPAFPKRPVAAFIRLNPAAFWHVRLGQEAKTIYWEGLARVLIASDADEPAPLDFCPDVLNRMSVSELSGQEQAGQKSFLMLNDDVQSNDRSELTRATVLADPSHNTL